MDILTISDKTTLYQPNSDIASQFYNVQHGMYGRFDFNEFEHHDSVTECDSIYHEIECYVNFPQEEFIEYSNSKCDNIDEILDCELSTIVDIVDHLNEHRIRLNLEQFKKYLNIVYNTYRGLNIESMSESTIRHTTRIVYNSSMSAESKRYYFSLIQGWMAMCGLIKTVDEDDKSRL